MFGQIIYSGCANYVLLCNDNVCTTAQSLNKSHSTKIEYLIKRFTKIEYQAIRTL